MGDSFVATGLTIEDDLLSRAAKATKGYAYLVQLVGYSIWQRANLHRVKSANVSERDVIEGIALAEARFHDVVHEPGPTRVPGAVLLPAVRPAALPHVDLTHVGPDRVVHDPVHDRDGWTPPRSSLS